MPGMILPIFGLILVRMCRVYAKGVRAPLKREQGGRRVGICQTRADYHLNVSTPGQPLSTLLTVTAPIYLQGIHSPFSFFFPPPYVPYPRTGDFNRLQTSNFFHRFYSVAILAAVTFPPSVLLFFIFFVSLFYQVFALLFRQERVERCVRRRERWIVLYLYPFFDLLATKSINTRCH